MMVLPRFHRTFARRKLTRPRTGSLGTNLTELNLQRELSNLHQSVVNPHLLEVLVVGEAGSFRRAGNFPFTLGISESGVKVRTRAGRVEFRRWSLPGLERPVGC